MQDSGKSWPIKEQVAPDDVRTLVRSVRPTWGFQAQHVLPAIRSEAGFHKKSIAGKAVLAIDCIGRRTQRPTFHSGLRVIHELFRCGCTRER